MKTKLTITLACLTACTLFAQQPAPTPFPTAGPSQGATMTLPPQTNAALLAGNIISQVSTLLNNVIQVLDNGLPAQPNQPAIEAKDIQAALGAENVMKLRSVVALLSGQPSPTPAPSPGQ